MNFIKNISCFCFCVLLVLLNVNTVEANEDQLIAIKEEIKSLEEKFKAAEQAAGEKSGVQAHITSAEAQIAESKEAFTESERRISEKEYLLSVYQSAFRVVTTLPKGESLGTLTMPDGSSLQNVVFIGVSRGAVQLQTTSGLKTVSAAGLPAQLATKFQLPPAIPLPSSNLKSIYSEKPEIAMTDADKLSQETATGGSSESAEPVADAPPAMTGEQERIARNDARSREIQDFRSKYSASFAQLKKVKAKRYAQQAAFNGAKIKKAKASQDKVFAVLDDEIDKIETQLRNFKDGITRLRSEME